MPRIKLVHPPLTAECVRARLSNQHSRRGTYADHVERMITLGQLTSEKRDRLLASAREIDREAAPRAAEARGIREQIETLERKLILMKYELAERGGDDGYAAGPDATPLRLALGRRLLARLRLRQAELEVEYERHYDRRRPR